ncbi:MAG: phosphatidylserine decarboxylase family protein [Rickettsiales bacterium]|nr:phosphatidylserine decarboxylase family protein [Rickettsiales bacterium]
MKNKKLFFQDLFEKVNTWLNDVEFLKSFLVPIHSAGFPFIIIFALVSLILGSISDFLGWLGIFLTAWCVYFFRDPIRVVPNIKDSIISPADGKVLPIIEVQPPEEIGIKEKMKKISIFMNVFNVHVNRVPIGGKIKKLSYEPGAFFNASLDKASKLNERMSIKLEVEKGIEIVFVQIAGLIARRIKCELDENQIVKSGEKFGLIRFGSRLDIYLPLDSNINILEGQTVIAGETIIANLKRKKTGSKSIKT